MESISIRQERDRVLVIKDGRLVADLPWHAALQLARAIHVKGKAAEEYDKAENVILDQAVLFRSGAPFGLTRRMDMLKESVKEALSNRQLRRYLPGGIKSSAVVGTPRIIQVGGPNDNRRN